MVLRAARRRCSGSLDLRTANHIEKVTVDFSEFMSAFNQANPLVHTDFTNSPGPLMLSTDIRLSDAELLDCLFEKQIVSRDEVLA